MYALMLFSVLGTLIIENACWFIGNLTSSSDYLKTAYEPIAIVVAGLQRSNLNPSSAKVVCNALYTLCSYPGK
jgi:hypothetical protein